MKNIKENDLIEELISSGFVKMPDGRQLYELSLEELLEKYKQIKKEGILA